MLSFYLRLFSEFVILLTEKNNKKIKNIKHDFKK